MKNRSICPEPSCRNHGSYCRLHLNYTVPVKSEISKKSDKQKELDRKFAKTKREYLKKHPVCEVSIEGEKCKKDSVDVHHKRGKVTEEDLLNPAFFLACCRPHHIIIESNPAWAKLNGYSESRLKTVKKAS